MCGWRGDRGHLQQQDGHRCNPCAGHMRHMGIGDAVLRMPQVMYTWPEPGIGRLARWPPDVSPEPVPRDVLDPGRERQVAHPQLCQLAPPQPALDQRFDEQLVVRRGQRLIDRIKVLRRDDLPWLARRLLTATKVAVPGEIARFAVVSNPRHDPSHGTLPPRLTCEQNVSRS